MPVLENGIVQVGDAIDGWGLEHLKGEVGDLIGTWGYVLRFLIISVTLLGHMMIS